MCCVWVGHRLTNQLDYGPETSNGDKDPPFPGKLNVLGATLPALFFSPRFSFRQIMARIARTRYTMRVVHNLLQAPRMITAYTPYEITLQWVGRSASRDAVLTQTKAGFFSVVASVSFVRIYSTPKCDANAVRSAYEHTEGMQEGARPADPIKSNLGNEFAARISLLYSESHARLLGVIPQRSLPTWMLTNSIVIRRL